MYIDCDFSVMYGGITISSTKKAAINVTSRNTKATHKKSQNVSETLKKLTKMQTGMTISKTTASNVIPVRKCKTEPKNYAEENEDDDFVGVDDKDIDPNFDGNDENGYNDVNDNVDDDNDDDDDYVNDDDDDDDDYSPTGKKSKTVSKASQSKSIKSNNNDTSSKFKSIKINAPPVFLCMKCKNKFESLADLKQHVFQRNACTTSQLTCKVCDKTFDNRKRLQQHSKVHEEKTKYICDQCGKLYTNQFNLENHKSSQHGEYLEECQNIFKCRLCNEKYSNRTDLYLHMKTHTKDTQQLLCDTCGKCFANAHNLKSHQKVHLDIRPFACTLCPKRFRTRLILKQHLHVHTGIKEFQCGQCLQSFAKADSLRVHTRKKHPEIKIATNNWIKVNLEPTEELPIGSHTTQPLQHSTELPATVSTSTPMLEPSTSSIDSTLNENLTEPGIDVVQ